MTDIADLFDENSTRPLTIRELAPADLEAALQLDGTAFLGLPPKDFLDDVISPIIEVDRMTGVFDGPTMVGLAGIYSKHITLPGARPTPFAGVSWVSVRPGYTGRGILRMLMKDQLQRLHDQTQEPIAVLTATESGLYGRYGYGLASKNAKLEIPHGLTLKAPVPTGTVRQVSREVAWPHIRAVHARVAATRTGYLGRPDTVWNLHYSDHDFMRNGASPLEFAIHQDGFVAFRTKLSFDDRGPTGELNVTEFCAETSAAAAALWQHLLSYSMVREITVLRASVDDIVSDLVIDPRAIKTSVKDHLWLRIVDLERAIALRAYSAAADVVVRVRDTHCSWNDETWRLSLTTEGGQATRSDSPATVELDIAALGAAFLGGTPIARLAQAGQVTGTPEQIASLDRAFSTPLAPWSPEGF